MCKRKYARIHVQPAGSSDKSDLDRSRHGDTSGLYLQCVGKFTEKVFGFHSIQFGWKNTERAGHIVNLDRTPSGQLRIKDNQRGPGERSEWIGDAAVLEYLSRMKYIGRNVPKLLRIDNMKFDHLVASQIMTGA